MKDRSAAKREKVEFLRRSGSKPGRCITWRLPTENGPGSNPDGMVLNAQAPNRMKDERCFQNTMNAERTGLVESHHHAGLTGEGEQPVNLTTGSRAGGCGSDGSFYLHPLSVWKGLR